MQRDIASRRAERTPRPCPRCGAPLRGSHREYTGGGASVAVLRCTACGHVVTAAVTPDADRSRSRRSRRHAPVDEGPPANPVLDPDTARRLLEEMDG